MQKSPSLALIMTPIVLSLFLLTACDGKSTITTSNLESSAATESITTDAWLGKWNGPEGTFIEIAGGNGSYEITIQDLDGPKQYQGNSSGDQITFERNGTPETIQASNGTDTGMKWLADKTNCLKVHVGEGWCRD